MGLQHLPPAIHSLRVSHSLRLTPSAQMKARIVEDAVSFVDQFVPGLAEHITASEVGTPVTWERFCQWPGGTMYGVPPTGRRLEAEAFLRPHTPIKNLWLAGERDLGTGKD